MNDPLTTERRKNRRALVLGLIVLIPCAAHAFWPLAEDDVLSAEAANVATTGEQPQPPSDLDASGFLTAVLWPAGGADEQPLEGDLPPETRPVALVGIVIEGAHRQAALSTNEELALLSAGQQWGPFTLVGIEPDHVVLQHGSRQWRIVIEDGPRALAREDR